MNRTQDAIRCKAAELKLKANNVYHGSAYYSSPKENEFELISNNKRGYIAGIVDGEGNISNSVNKGRNNTLDVRVSIYNSDKRLIDWLHKNIPSSRLCLRKTSTYPNAKKQWVIRIDGSLKAKKFLYILYPFLIVKKKKAEEIFKHNTKYTPTWLSYKEVMKNAGKTIQNYARSGPLMGAMTPAQ